MCNKLLITQDDYEEHMNHHMGLKPYMCNKCGKGYKNKSSLNSHINYHCAALKREEADKRRLTL